MAATWPPTTCSTAKAYRLLASTASSKGRCPTLSIVRTLTVVDGHRVVNAPKTAASRRLVYLDSSTAFDRLVARSGLPRIRLHDLRHTYATLALRLGTHPVLLSERLGHSSIAVTIDLYSHVIPSIERHAADVVAQLILPGQE